MSDPVTNVEIEDVLSSIRKLVAQETRQQPAVQRAKPDVDRLVLTPALRVDEVKDDADVPAPPAPPRPDPVSERAMDEIPRDARLSEYGAVEGAFPDFDALEPGADDARHNAVARTPTLAEIVEDEVAEALGVAADAVEGTGAAKVPFADDAASDESAAKDGNESETLLAEPEAEPAGDPVEAAKEAAPEQAAPMTLEAKVAALGRLVARDTTDYEEERDLIVEETPSKSDTALHDTWTLRDAASGQDIPIEDKAEEPEPNILKTELTEESEPEPAVDAELAEQSPLAGPAFELDDAALRQIVSDIVRQELQGVMGERITRNVRKLVRREIHRMLISQDLE